MQPSNERSSSIAKYLDIWRGAFYSVILGLLYQASLFSDTLLSSTLPLSLWIFIFFITVFLILDGVTRHSARQIIRHTSFINISNATLFFELLWVTLEFVGLIIFAVWAFQTIPSVKMIESAQAIFSITVLTVNSFFSVPVTTIHLFGWFCIMNFLHNGSQIQADKGPKLLRWIGFSFSRDATELDSVTKRWAKYSLLIIDKAHDRYNSSMESLCKEAQCAIGENTTFIPIIRLLKLLIYKPTRAKFHQILSIFNQTFKLSIIHFILQYLQLHLLLFNVIPALAFFFIPPSGVWHTYWPQTMTFRFEWVPLSAIILMLLISLVSYLCSAYFEINRSRDANGAENKPEKAEIITQAIGNVFLAAFLLVWEAYLPIFMLIMLVLLENVIFVISIHLINKTPTIKEEKQCHWLMY